MRVFNILAAAALMMAATATSAAPRLTGEARIAKALEGRIAGKPQSCIQLRSIQSSEIVDRTAILYRTSDGTLYLNRPNGANFLNDDDILVSNTYGSQLCNIDIIRLVERGSMMSNGSIGLNEFVPYKKPDRR